MDGIEAHHSCIASPLRLTLATSVFPHTSTFQPPPLPPCSSLPPTWQKQGKAPHFYGSRHACLWMHVCALLAHQPGLCPAQHGAADRLQITVRQHIWREVGRRPERATSFPKHTRGWVCRGVRLGVPRSSPRLVRTGRQGLSARHRASSGCAPPGVACRSRPRTWMMLCTVEDLRRASSSRGP